MVFLTDGNPSVSEECGTSDSDRLLLIQGLKQIVDRIVPVGVGPLVDVGTLLTLSWNMPPQVHFISFVMIFCVFIFVFDFSMNFYDVFLTLHCDLIYVQLYFCSTPCLLLLRTLFRRPTLRLHLAASLRCSATSPHSHAIQVLRRLRQLLHRRSSRPLRNLPQNRRRRLAATLMS